MKLALPLSIVFGLGAVAGSSLFVRREVVAAKDRLEAPPSAEVPQAAVADHTEEPYCTPQFRAVLSRVVDACGLSGQDARRGCEPVDVKTFASIDESDFNALFDPLVKRGAIVLFDDNSDKLDESAKKIIDEKWAERRGARYFFVVARASKKGGVDYNRQLSQRRANSVMFQLQETSGEDDLSKQVGMLWLGSEYAQLSKDYCGTWSHSREGKKCDAEAINRSAFISWVDCRL
jgi:outer membrane protein OmpA-like peptidoglycan-associated protein